jgi:hypothetical protein
MSSSTEGPGAGYLDEVLSIFDSRKHPFVIVSSLATRWMGARTPVTEEIYILVRNSQQTDLINSLVSTGPQFRELRILAPIGWF